MRQRILFFSLLLLAPLANLAAQEATPLSPGARVRVSALRQGRKTGILMAINADTLVLKLMKKNTPLAIPLSSVTRLDVSLGWSQHKNAGKGAGFGFIAGGALGGLVSYYIAAAASLGGQQTYPQSSPPESWDSAFLAPASAASPGH